MDKLLKNILPDFILDQYSKGNYDGSLYAVVIMADVSGFTPMTEELLGEGKAGIESLSDTMTAIFAPLVRIVHDRGGFISSFAGDAFTALFAVEKPDINEFQKIADEMITKHNSQRPFKTEVNDFDLGIKIGFSYGTVEWGMLFNGGILYPYFRGQAIDRAADNLKKAETGSKVYDSFGSVENTGKNCISKSNTFFKPKIDNYKGIVREDIQFLGSGGEFREIVCCVISFKPVSRWRQFILEVIRRSENYGGFFNKIEFGDKGGLAFIIFGAPRALENMYKRAVRFIMEINQLEEFGAEQVSGISAGLSFTGFIGCDERSEYSALGSVVNRAVRYLDRACSKDILIDETVYLKIKKDIIVEIFKDEKFKGIKDNRNIFRIIRKREKIPEDVNLSLFVGRIEEKKYLEQKIKPVFYGSFGGFIYLDGEAGIGKSRLISEVRRNILSNKIMNLKEGTSNWFYMPCDPILGKSFNPIVSFLMSYFEQSENNTPEINRALFESKLFDLTCDIDDISVIKETERTKSFLAALINIFWEGSLYSQVDPKGKYENTVHAIKNFIIAKSLQEPVIIEISDGIWADTDTCAIFDAVLKNLVKYPVVIITDTRNHDDGTLKKIISDENIPVTRIKLEKLETDVSREMITNLLVSKMPEVSSVPEATVKFIRKKSEDNPFFIEQIILFYLKQDLFNDDLTLKTEGLMIPSSINSIIIARMDRLGAKLKDLIEHAAVLGRKFNSLVLTEMMENKNISRYLSEGQNEKIWNKIKDDEYIFTHALISETVYNMQLEKHLKKLHGLAGLSFEKVFSADPDQYYYDIAVHYDKAGQTEKAVKYLKKAGVKAQEEFRNKEAIRLFSRLLQIIGTKDQEKISCEMYLRIAEIQQLTGDWKNAEMNFEKARDLSEISGDSDIKGMVLRNMAWQYFLRGDHKRSLKCYEDDILLTKVTSSKGFLSHSYRKIGIIHQIRKDHQKAQEFYNKSLKIALEKNLKKEIAAAKGSIGILHKDKGEYEKALELLKEQYRIAVELKDMKNLNAAIANIGITYECMGKYKLALESNDELLDLAAAVGDRYMMSAAYCNRGVNYENMGYFEDAEKNYLESMKISEDIGDIEGNALMLRNIGNLYLSNNDYDSASRYLNKSLEISEKINLEWNLLELYIVLIELNLIFYKLEWAEKFCNKLKNIVNKSDYDNSQKLNAYRNIIIFYKSKNNEEKIKAVEKTALLVQKIQKTEDKAKISYQVAKMYYDMNNKNKTDKSIKIALEILNRIYSSQPKKMFKILIDDLLKMKI